MSTLGRSEKNAVTVTFSEMVFPFWDKFVIHFQIEIDSIDSIDFSNVVHGCICREILRLV